MILKEIHVVVGAKYGNIKEGQKDHCPFFMLMRLSYETER